MRMSSSVASTLKTLWLAGVCFLLSVAHGQNNVNVRVMAANLNGNTQSYQPFALRILQGLKPDVVAIQEFNYTSTNGLGVNTPAAFREMLDTAFGTSFVYFRESGSYNIPNGIISRYPILNSGSWTGSAPDRGYAWAQIQLPGTNTLYIVSVHLLTKDAPTRSTEATALKNLIQSNFPTNAWVVLAGDFNTDTRTESTTMTTCDSYLSDNPIPVDDLGNSDTSINRNHPHDYVMPSFNLTNLETATVFPTHIYSNGLVFDSRVYSNLNDFAPAQSADSGLAQHMAVMKDFSIPAGPATNPPAILTQPQGQTNAVGATISFSVAASGSGTLNYQWLFNGTNISGATANPLVLANVQLTSSGNYSVTITNIIGSVTSSNALLTVTNAPPAISIPPQSQNILAGQTAVFGVTASGTLPLNFQWLLGGTNIFGATTNPFVLTNVQATNAGNYSVVITNVAGSVTSSVATLALLFTNPVVFAQWNFNSVPPDGSTTTGTTTPAIGSGTAALIGGATATFATGDATFDPAGSTDNSGWNTTTYPTQGTANKSRGAQFAVSTAGKQNISVSWSSQASNTGSKYGRLQYTTNGTDFVDFPAAFTNGTAFTVKTNSLAGIPGVSDNPSFAIRFVAEFESTAIGTTNGNYVAAGTTYGTSGTMRYDMVSFSGTAILAGMPAVLGAPVIAGGQVGFTISGSAGVNYVVQTATNLGAASWIPIYTNVAPFSFSDTNQTGRQKFYRAVSQ